MTADEFVKTCVTCGYASAKTAREYAIGKENLAEEDLEEVWRINERLLDLKNDRIDSGRRGTYKGTKSTKKLRYSERNGG